MNNEAHGGDLLRMAAIAGRDPAALIDFSVNIRPEGPPEFIRVAMFQAMTRLAAYPSPHAEEVMLAAATYHRMDADCFVFGNGSNELIHALARVIKKRGIASAYVIEPAFSEYALACRCADMEVISLWGGIPELSHKQPVIENALPDDRYVSAMQSLRDAIQSVPTDAAVFLANPANPSGFFLQRKDCLSLMAQRPDLLWIIDEAFIEYAGQEADVSVLHRLPPNAVVLRSLTKFYAVPGVRLGYLVTNSELAEAIRTALPVWTVNAFALAAALAVFADSSGFADTTRLENARRRDDLVTRLATIPSLCVYPSVANYVLFRCSLTPWAPRNLHNLLLQHFGIAIRDCSNYCGLEDGTWFRVAVRFPEEHQQLVEALQELLEKIALSGKNTSPSSSRPHTAHTSSAHTTPVTPALMLQGTSSNAGKSILSAAYCRILQQDGYHVAPFKAQNMSLNSGVTTNGDEMGRAQIVQAQAARIDPDVRMNPILLKPHSDTGSQIIVLGQPIGHMGVADYIKKKKELWHIVTNAYNSLAAEHDVMVLEGAGSPAEINLKAHDVVNMRMAKHAKASVLLVGDIDRGGVYASFLGTWMTLTDMERRLLIGYIVNRFRGDASLLDSAHTYMFNSTGIPVLGTIPYIRDLNIPEEDMAGFSFRFSSGVFEEQAITNTAKHDGIVDIAVIMLRHISNYTDFAPLDIEPDVRLRPVRCPEEWGNPDVVIVPGSKSVVPDLEDLRKSGLADKILTHAANGKWIFGICGGLQILGQTILDPHAIESTIPKMNALGLMELSSTFAADKTLVHVNRAETPLGVLSGGYEIHHGLTQHGPSALPLFLRADHVYSSETERICGYVTERRWATYLHGIFDDDIFRRAWLDHVRADIGLIPQGCQLASYDLEKALDRLADIVREHSDVKTIYQRMGLQ